MKSLVIALRAISHLPRPMLLGHIRRRLRNRLVPFVSRFYRAKLVERARVMPPFAPSLTAEQTGEITAVFFASKHQAYIHNIQKGEFTFLNVRYSFSGIEQVDWLSKVDHGNHRLWRSNLAFMGYLVPLADQDPELCLSIAVRLVRHFQSEQDLSTTECFLENWHSYAVSQRLLALCTMLIRLPDTMRQRKEFQQIDQFICLNAVYLMRNLETELGNNHLERNLSALCLFGLTRAWMPVSISRILVRYLHELLHDSIGDDGVQKERSAMYQALTVQSLRIFSRANVFAPETHALIEQRLSAAEIALAALTLGDGEPVMMNDAWAGEVPQPRQILKEEAPRFHVMRDAGYVRMSDSSAVLVFDAGPVGVDVNPGHGHADFLSFELSVGRTRFIVDPGTFTYSAGQERMETRLWSAHNGPCFPDRQPVEFLGSFRIGRRAGAELLEAREEEDRQIARGKLSFSDVNVARDLVLTEGMLDVTDRWSGPGPRQVRLLIPEQWSPSQQKGGIVFSTDKASVLLSVRNQAVITLRTARWSMRYGIWEKAHEVILTPSTENSPLHWQLHWTEKSICQDLAQAA